MARLLDSIERKFPRAKITVSAVLPTKYGYIEKINNFNKAAAEVCSSRNVKFLDFGSEFLNEKSLYSDRDGDNVHLADPGTEILLKQLQKTLGLNQPQVMQAPQIPVGETSRKTDDQEGQKIETSERKDDQEGQKIETVISDRSEPDEVATVQTQDDPPSTPNNSDPDGFVYIEPQTAIHGNIFQAFAAPCNSHDDVNEFCDNIKKKFPATKTASSFMVVYSFQQNGKQASSFRNDGEKGAGQRMVKMMEMIGMRNTCVIITRHYRGQMYGARWTIIQSQMSQMARMMGYTVPTHMNIHKFFPRSDDKFSSSRRRQQYPPYNRSDNYGYSQNSLMSDNQRELL